MQVIDRRRAAQRKHTRQIRLPVACARVEIHIAAELFRRVAGQIAAQQREAAGGKHRADIRADGGHQLFQPSGGIGGGI